MAPGSTRHVSSWRRGTRNDIVTPQKNLLCRVWSSAFYIGISWHIYILYNIKATSIVQAPSNCSCVSVLSFIHVFLLPSGNFRHKHHHVLQVNHQTKLATKLAMSNHQRIFTVHFYDPGCNSINPTPLFIGVN